MKLVGDRLNPLQPERSETVTSDGSAAGLNFQQLFEAIPGAYLVLAADAPKFTIVAVNNAYLHATKTQRSEILGRGMFEVFPDNPADETADGVQNLRRSLEAVIATRTAHTMAMQKYDISRPLTEGGGFEERYWKPLNSPILDANGDVVQIINHVEDVTELMRLRQQQATKNEENQALRSTTRSLERRNEQMEAEADLRSQELALTDHRLQTAYLEAEVIKTELQHILGSIQDGFYVLDANWRYTYVNDRQLEMIQMRREEVLGKSVWDLFPEAIDSDGYQQMQRTAIDRTATHFEFLHPIWNRWFEHHVYPFDGGISVVCTEITDRKLAEQERDRFFALSLDMLAIANFDGYLTRLNPAWEATLGWSEAELMAAPYLDFVHPDDRARTLAEAQNLSRGIPTIQFENRYRCKNNGYRWFSWTCTAELSQNQIYAVAHDVTDRKIAEATLRESEARFRAYAENSKDVIWITAAQDYRLVYLCPAYETVWGRSIADLFIDLSQFIDSIHPDDRDRVAQGWQQCAQGLFMQEYRIVRPDGEIRWIYDRGFPIYDADGNLIYVGGVAQDISDRKMAERDREALLEREQIARQEAERANRLKDEFLAVLSHELRSPLNPILGWTRLLRTRSFDAQATDRALETIERNAKLQTQLIEDLLDVSRILQGKLILNVQPVHLAQTIEAAIETVRLAAEAKQIEIQTDLEAIAPVAGEASRLQQVVWNLLSNAIKFTPSGGRVEIRLTAIEKFAQLQVQDTGIGIAADFLPFVFDYFRQQDSKTTRKFGGLGLGLAIVRHITELHGGSVSVSSAGEKQGATFTVLLPLMPIAHASPSADTRHPTPDTPFSNLRILVVDDEPDMRDLVLTVLEPSGAIVQAASTATEALQAIDSSPFDLLICDIGMPEMDGHMLIQQIRSTRNSIPAIALTAFASESDREAAIAAGFQLHLGKPIDPQELLEKIAALMQRI